MQNLELKVRLVGQKERDDVESRIKQYYTDTLIQTDTYFVVPNGRLKLREEVKTKVYEKHAYGIRYFRPDVAEAKMSHYETFVVEDVPSFMKVFGDALNVEIVVQKVRKLYLIRNARIHLDTVKDLGSFL